VSSVPASVNEMPADSTETPLPEGAGEPIPSHSEELPIAPEPPSTQAAPTPERPAVARPAPTVADGTPTANGSSVSGGHSPEESLRPPANWPMLTCSGVVGKGASGSAIISSEIVGVGESVQGVKVLSIRAQGVELEYEGETRFLKVGSALQ